jgi:hypothetical protein
MTAVIQEIAATLQNLRKSNHSSVKLRRRLAVWFLLRPALFHIALASRARAFGGSRLSPLLAKSVAERVAEIQSQDGMSTLRRNVEKVPGEQFGAVSAQQRFNRCVFPESLLGSARAGSTGIREPTGGFDFFASEAGIQPR